MWTFRPKYLTLTKPFQSIKLTIIVTESSNLANGTHHAYSFVIKYGMRI